MPPHGKILQFTVIDEIRRTQSDAPNKMICLELIRFDEDGRKELRLGYYILGKLPTMRDRWVWGSTPPSCRSKTSARLFGRLAVEDGSRDVHDACPVVTARAKSLKCTARE